MKERTGEDKQPEDILPEVIEAEIHRISANNFIVADSMRSFALFAIRVTSPSSLACQDLLVEAAHLLIKFTGGGGTLAREAEEMARRLKIESDLLRASTPSVVTSKEIAFCPACEKEWSAGAPAAKAMPDNAGDSDRWQDPRDLSGGETDLPGMLAVAKGVAEQRWPHTMDAKVWAEEFVKLNPGADEGLMLSWFANAIMAGYDTANARSSLAWQKIADMRAVEVADLRRALMWCVEHNGECLGDHSAQQQLAISALDGTGLYTRSASTQQESDEANARWREECATPAPASPPTSACSNVESIPEYFAKPGITEALAGHHPTLLIRQMANEILRLRADRPSAMARPEIPLGLELPLDVVLLGNSYRIEDASGKQVPWDQIRAILRALDITPKGDSHG